MNKRQTGSAYEMLAADWLKQHGYQITEKNYRCGQGEIDLIAEKDGYLVFVEVKYRRTGQKGDPAEAVDLSKTKKDFKSGRVLLLEKKEAESAMPL